MNKSKEIYEINIRQIIFSSIFFGALFTTAKALIALTIILLTSKKAWLTIIDRIIILWLIFILTYFINLYYNNANDKNFNLQLLILPVASYWIGKETGLKIKNGNQFFISTFLMGTSLSFFTTYSVILSIYKDGFSGLSRSIEIIGFGQTAVSATVLGGLLIVTASLAGTLFCKSDELSKYWKILFFITLILSTIASLRLGSRTLLAISLISLVFGYVINRKTINSGIKFIFITSICAMPIAISYAIESESILINYFADRISDEAYSSQTAGGRSEKWLASIELILNNPFGWDLSINGYSHNLWLDTARNGGWISFTLICIHTILLTITYLKSINKNKCSKLFITTTTCLMIGFNLLFFVEPIFEGFLYSFAAYLGFIGLITTTKINRYTKTT